MGNCSSIYEYLQFLGTSAIISKNDDVDLDLKRDDKQNSKAVSLR